MIRITLSYTYLNERSNYAHGQDYGESVYRIPHFADATASRRPGAVAGDPLRPPAGRDSAHATEVFYKKGYEGASMRDLSRASGMSLAGLYYYFESKERCST